MLNVNLCSSSNVDFRVNGSIASGGQMRHLAVGDREREAFPKIPLKVQRFFLFYRAKIWQGNALLHLWEK